MKRTTTEHTEVGYGNNIDIVEIALREQFGFTDSSHVLRAVAAHIWSHICRQDANQKHWTSEDVTQAIAACQSRLHRMVEQLKDTDRLTQVVIRYDTVLLGPRYLKFPARPEDYKKPAIEVNRSDASRFPDAEAAKQYLVNTGRALSSFVIELAV